MHGFFVRYPEANSVPHQCLVELEQAIEQPTVGYCMLELLQYLGRTTVVFTAGGPRVDTMEVEESGTDELHFIIGDWLLHGETVPLVDALIYLLPRHCRDAMEHQYTVPDALVP